MQKQKENFNWLFIGCGRIANIVANEISSSHNIYACYSRTKEKAEKFCRKYNAKLYTDLDLAFKDKNIDCIYIATPHSTHYNLMKKAIINKIPILCEKAFTMNKKQAEEIFKLAKENNVYVVEGMWTLFNPIIKEVLDLIKNNELGEIEHFRGSMCYSAKLSLAPNRVTDKKYGGGALLDTAVYPISFATNLFGLPESIDVRADFDSITNVDNSIYGMFKYKNNKSFEFESSISRFSKCKGLIIGSKGNIYFPFCFYKPQKAIIEIQGKKKKVIKAKRGYIYQFDQVRKDILENKKESIQVPKELTLNVMQICDQIRKNLNIIYDKEIERI